MDNDSPLDGNYLGTISADFVKVADRLNEASYTIRKKERCLHPIFIMSKQEKLPSFPILIEKGEVGNQWCYHVAYADAFIECGLIAGDKAEDFKSTYKDPDKFCCLFVMDETFIKFVYMPYPEEES